jgi:hypothetical protein
MLDPLTEMNLSLSFLADLRQCFEQCFLIFYFLKEFVSEWNYLIT